MHAILTGRFDLCDLLAVLLEKLGTCREMHVSTLSFAARNLTMMQDWIESHAVGTISLLCSKFFSRHFPDLIDSAQSLLTPPHRLGIARCHAKVVTMDMEDGATLCMETSANLRSSSNWEQCTLYRGDAALSQWHRTWISKAIDHATTASRPQ